METVENILKKAVQKLQEGKIHTPQLDAEVILSNLLQVERIKLHIYPEMEISREICQKFWTKVEKRLKNMPVQYIVHNQEFMGLDFWVEEGVLIPRADTEILVEKILDIYNENYSPSSIRLMDIGVGSGAISVSLAKLIERSQVYAVDISPKALEVAFKNAKIHGIEDKIVFLKGSLFHPLQGKTLEKAFDIIVSNPPYIPKRVIETLDKEVRDYEPHGALDGGEDGLDFYKKIIEKAPVFLKEKGLLAFEIGYDQGKDISNIMGEKGFSSIEVIKDLAGHDRVVLGNLIKNS